MKVKSTVCTSMSFVTYFGKEDMAEGFFSFFPPFTNLVGRGHKLCGFTNHQCPTATNEFTSKSPLDKKAEELC